MKKSTLVVFLFLVLSFLQTTAQRTFERFLNKENIYGVDQNPDGSYILSFDSSSGDGIMKLDACGRPEWTSFPSVRGANENIMNISYDPFTGGFIAGGNVPAIAGIYDTEPSLMQLDANGIMSASRILPPGNLGGIVSSVRARPDSGYVAGILLDNFGGAKSSKLVTFNSALDSVWSFSGAGSIIAPPAVAIDGSNQYLFSSYNSPGSSAPVIRQLDASGVLQNTFVIPDTFMGGCSFFYNAVIDQSPDGNYIAAATLSPTSSSNDFPYILKLDNVLNVVWQKYLNWGKSAQVRSVLATPDSGSLCMITSLDTVIFLKLNINGDSLWSRTYAGKGTVKANYMRRCMDGGYVISGSTSDGVNNYGLVLKLDSLARLLPPVCVDADPSTSICPGSDVILSADSGYHYVWSTSDTTRTILVDTAGTYFVTVTDSSTGLSAVSEPVVVSIYPVSNPVINLLVTILVSTPAVSYQWLFNGDTMIGQTSMQVIPQLTGDYTVIVEDSNGCILSSAPFPYLMPGIEKLESNSAFTINRINREIVDVTLFASQNGLLRLMDIRGATVREIEVKPHGQQSMSIPVSDLATGIYTLVWTSDESLQVEKLLIGQ